MPDQKPFSQPIDASLKGRTVTVSSAEDARDLLMDVDWPSRGARHTNALDLCHKVLAGERSTAEAEEAFRLALDEASGGG
jgi:hypothetical protein